MRMFLSVSGHSSELSIANHSTRSTQVIWWRNEKARPKHFNAVSHNHVRSKVLFSPCQNVTDHFPCLPNFLLLNAKSKNWSWTGEICPRDRHVKFKNNTSGPERLWDTALNFCAQASSLRHQITWTVSQLKCVSNTISSWFENHQPQKTKISSVIYAPFIQNSNQMASRLTVTTSFPRVF